MTRGSLSCYAPGVSQPDREFRASVCGVDTSRPRTFQFFVPGIPAPDPRVKAFSRGRHAGVYKPKGAWQEWAKRVALMTGAAPKPAHDGPVRMSIEYRMPRPKSLPKKFADGSYCWRKPDVDNMEKLVLDVLKKRGWFTDDGRVADVAHRKVYSSKPGMAVVIELLDEGAMP